MAGYLVSGDAERGKRCEIEKWHCGCNRRWVPSPEFALDERKARGIVDKYIWRKYSDIT
jgi:hypothetical protein